MRKILLSAAAAASLLALPAFAQSTANQLSNDPEIRLQQEWQQLVAQTNADRLGHALIGPAMQAAPVSDKLSSDSEIRVQQEWQLLVAKTNADRKAVQALADVAANR